ncbi:HYD1 signature containing ADP-ribosyltransferase family protein [Bradyrhizobium betae]|uniref:HYD1 signature containing ADP-ribosyltransferase family protein n=1 Tax=Bradyrhizobium betae TaxID=244734 RepID=UPI003D676A58
MPIVPANIFWLFIMADYSLVPVEHQPDFENASLIPVDHDPFSADGVSQQAQSPQVQAQTQPAQFQQAQTQQPTIGEGRSSAPILGDVTTEPTGSVFRAGASDFFRSIPRGVVSGFNSAASALGRATQAEMGQDVDAPTPQQGIQILEKEVTGPMYRPEGRAGQFGASVGEFLGNPASYMAPGSAPLKVGAAVLGGLGSEAGGQLGEGTPWEGPLRFAGGALGVLGPLGAARLGTGARAAETVAHAATEGVRAGRTLYHYTDEAGLNAILNEQKLNPSLKALRPRDVRYGNGQYLTDIEPGATSAKELSKALVNNPHQVDKFSHYLEIDPAGLNVIEGRPRVHVIPNEVPLDLNNRILSHGKVPYR